MNSFEDVRLFLNSIPNINRGGCGFAALAMYEWLKENDDKTQNISIIHLDYEEISERPSSCAHVCIKYKNTLFDSKGKLDKSKFPYKKEVSIEHHLNSLKFGEWNTMFQRRGNLTKIEKTLKIKIKNKIK
jgi:hypothetical protein